jgi:hypothetical protein
MKTELEKRFRELEKTAEWFWPLVHCKWGYAAFFAYVFKIKPGENTPSEWWVGELDEDRKIVAVYQICQY